MKTKCVCKYFLQTPDGHPQKCVSTPHTARLIRTTCAVYAEKYVNKVYSPPESHARTFVHPQESLRIGNTRRSRRCRLCAVWRTQKNSARCPRSKTHADIAQTNTWRRRRRRVARKTCCGFGVRTMRACATRRPHVSKLAAYELIIYI